jgi:hypothetical protein
MVASSAAAGHPGVIWWKARPRRHDLEADAAEQWAHAIDSAAFHFFALETNAEVEAHAGVAAEVAGAEAAQEKEVAGLVNARPGTPAGHRQEAASERGGIERLLRREPYRPFGRSRQ